MTKKQFIKTVYDFYRDCGRHSLPWRQTYDPYAISVSEIMLQQTQVDRVIPKYEAFMSRFPTLESLALAPLGDVLHLWQGLGYNRRAKMLHQCAGLIVERHSGRVPENEVMLCALPGIGQYTARAILTFAFKIPVPLIETNVRTVYIHHFFPHTEQVTDAMLWPLLEATLDVDNPRDWYYAIMDYGSYLKGTIGNIGRKSSTYTKQSKFAGSDRQIRGAILRALITSKTLTLKKLLQVLAIYDADRVAVQVIQLQSEGMVAKNRSHYTLPT